VIFAYHCLYAAELANPAGGEAGALRIPFAVLGNAGRTCLYMFFSLSAFLLARPFIAALMDRTSLPDWRSFLRNRALRIVPAFWLIFTIVWLRNLLLPSAAPHELLRPSWLDQGAVYGFAQVFHQTPSALLVGQAWTIDVEVQFYLSLPIIAAGMAVACHRLQLRRNRALLLAGGLGLVTVCSILVELASPATSAWRRNVVALGLAFAPGAALALIDAAVPAARLRSPRMARLSIALLFGLLAILIVMVVTDPLLPVYAPAAPAYVHMLAAAGGGSLLASAVMWQWAGRRLWGGLDSRPLRWLGKRSYSFYLWHQAILGEFGPLILGAGLVPSVWILTLGGFAVTAVATASTYELIERNFLSLRGRWRTAGSPEAKSHP
jgi:peptidoglycan/LPS O-acetylase OafA/YrhL